MNLQALKIIREAREKVYKENTDNPGLCKAWGILFHIEIYLVCGEHCREIYEYESAVEE
jgi:hypothetical protein